MARSEQEGAVQGIKDPAKRKAAYYKLQREHAEESGDQATTDKIYAKLGKKSHNVDSSRGDKAILGMAPFLPEAAAGLGEMAAARGAASLGKMIPRLGKGAESEAQSSRALVPRVKSSAPAKSVQHLGRATPVKKALPSNKRALGGSGKAPSVGSGETPKALTGGKVRAVSGSSRQANKALTSSGHSDYNAELGRQAKRSTIPGGKKGAVRGSRKKALK